MLQSETVKKYDTYKDSGIEWIGKIPETWIISRNKNVFSCGKDIVGSASATTQLLSLTKKGVVEKDINNAEGKLPESFDTYQYVEIDDMVMCLFDLDCSAVFSGISNFNGMISPAYKILKCRNIVPKYADYWFRYISDGRKFNHYAKNIRFTLNYEEFSALPILTPTKDEQQRIADYLDKKCSAIDEVIETEKSVIEKLKEYKQSIITEVVTKGLDKSVPLKDSGIEWISKIPQHWEVCKIKNYIDLKTGTTPSSNEPDLLNGDYNWFTPIDFTDNYILNNSSRKISILAKEKNVVTNFPINTVFIIGIGATTGKIGFSIVEGSCNQQITAMIAKANKISQKYLLYWMISNTKIIRETALYTTLPIINNATLGQYVLVKPPIEEQQQIAEYLDKKCFEIDKAIADKEQVIEKFTEYKKSLIYECVTGKKRV